MSLIMRLLDGIVPSVKTPSIHQNAKFPEIHGAGLSANISSKHDNLMQMHFWFDQQETHEEAFAENQSSSFFFFFLLPFELHKIDFSSPSVSESKIAFVWGATWFRRSSLLHPPQSFELFLTHTAALVSCWTFHKNLGENKKAANVGQRRRLRCLLAVVLLKWQRLSRCSSAGSPGRTFSTWRNSNVTLWRLSEGGTLLLQRKKKKVYRVKSGSAPRGISNIPL